MLSILEVSTKKWYSSFLKKLFVFQKLCFKVKVLKTFETFTDCHIKTCQSLKRRATLKIPGTVFRRSYALSFGSKMKILRKSAFECSDKNQLKFCRKSYWKKQHLFLLYTWWIRFSDICTTVELKEFNWLCKHMKTSEAANLVFQWIFSVKHKFFHVNIIETDCILILYLW